MYTLALGPRPEGSPSSRYLGKGSETKGLGSGCRLWCLCGPGTRRLWMPRGGYWSPWAPSVTTTVILSTLKLKCISYDHWFPTSSWPLHCTVFVSHPQHSVGLPITGEIYAVALSAKLILRIPTYSHVLTEDQLLFILPPSSYHVSSLSQLDKAVYLIFPYVHLVFHRTAWVSYLLK